MKLSKIDVIPGTDQDLLILAIVAAAGIYIATGGGANERWKQATQTGGPAAAALYYGKRKTQKAAQKGFEEGFNTLNPELHVEELMGLNQSGFRGNGQPDAPGLAKRVASGVASGVATAAAAEMIDRGIDYAVDRFTGDRGKPEPEVMPVVDEKAEISSLQKLIDERIERRKAERLRLRKLTVAELKGMARDNGQGGSWLSTARKAEIIDRLVDLVK